LKSLSCDTQVLVPISDADRNEGAFAIRASRTQAVFWDFFRQLVPHSDKAWAIDKIAAESLGFCASFVCGY
jgi:hypothetical protein